MKEKYIDLVLKALKVEDKDYLFVTMPKVIEDLKETILKVSKQYNLKEVHFEIEDTFKRHELLTTLDQENIYKHPMFDKSIYDKYAKLDAAFLTIISEIPNLMEDVDSKIMRNTMIHERKTNEYYRNVYERGELYWLIIAYPNEYWAKDLNMSLEELENKIYDICLIRESNDPYQEWNSLLDELQNKANILNDYNFSYLHYTSEAGTDLKVYLPKKHVWCSGKDPHGVINNIPTLEIFTSPEYSKTEGIVYATKPLLFDNTLIDDFSIEFKEGKATCVNASVGEEKLNNLIETDEYAGYLGECALVDINSKISQSNIIFKTTLFDENASCHLALGRGFNECLESKTDNLRDYGINVSKIHVDFMIGDETLNVVGITKNKEKVTIIENGSFVL